MSKLRCPECTTQIETNDQEVTCSCGKRLRNPTARTAKPHGTDRPPPATPKPGIGESSGGTLYRWEARRPNATLTQTADVRTTFFPIYPSKASIGLALAGNAFGSMAASSRQSKQIRREVKYTLQAAPRWRAQKDREVRLSGNWISLPFTATSVRRDLGTVQYWAVHPRKGQGVVLKFSDDEGLLRVKMPATASDQLVTALRAAAPSREGVWTPEPIDHPGMRRILDAPLQPSGGLLDLASKIAVAAIMLVGVIFWPVLILWGLGSLVLCQRDFDTFKPGWRTYVGLVTPVVGFIALTVLAAG